LELWTRGDTVAVPKQKLDPAEGADQPLRSRFDRLIRDLAMGLITALVSNPHEQEADPRGQSLQRILLVRANFRVGNVLLALPALTAFRKRYPRAQIDFVGAPVSRLLFQQQKLDRHYETPRRFPQVLWQFPILIRCLRAERYDLAVDVSCSHSGLTSFIVGLSGAHYRAGYAGKWERLLNIRIPKLREINKYKKLTALLTALGLDQADEVGRLEFTAAETSAGRAALEQVADDRSSQLIGVFVGGRKLRGKRWPLENFLELIAGLSVRGYRVVAMIGPEEYDLVERLKRSVPGGVPLIFEPSLRRVAAMIAHMDLFVCCDSGPMHLACAVSTRVVAIFRDKDVMRWAPPAHTARIVSIESTPAAVLDAALDELSSQRRSAQASSMSFYRHGQKAEKVDEIAYGEKHP
jgi:heptosyltransferase III